MMKAWRLESVNMCAWEKCERMKASPHFYSSLAGVCWERGSMCICIIQKDTSLCMCVCVCERETGGLWWGFIVRKRKVDVYLHNRERHEFVHVHVYVCVYVCVCMCVCMCACVCVREGARDKLTSLPYIIRWCVVMRALNTTTQLLLAVRSNSVSASWGTLTFISLVQWIRSTHTQTNKQTNKQRSTCANQPDPNSQTALICTLGMHSNEYLLFLSSLVNWVFYITRSK